MTADQNALERTAIRLKEAIAPFGEAVPTFFRDGADNQLVYRLNSMRFSLWESGRAHLIEASYRVSLYTRNYDPAIPVGMAVALSNAPGLHASGITVSEDDPSSYTVTDMTVTVAEPIIYDEEA